MSNAARAKRRSYNVRLIRRDYSYTTLEIAELLNVSVVTVRRWLEEGLPRNDDLRPFLIRGEALISFLETRQKRARVAAPTMSSIALVAAAREQRGPERSTLRSATPSC